MRYFICAIIFSLCPMGSIGNFEFTNGYLGNKPISTTSQQIGNFKFTNGDLGGLGLLDDCDN